MRDISKPGALASLKAHLGRKILKLCQALWAGWCDGKEGRESCWARPVGSDWARDLGHNYG